MMSLKRLCHIRQNNIVFIIATMETTYIPICQGIHLPLSNDEFIILAGHVIHILSQVAGFVIFFPYANSWDKKALLPNNL